MDEIRRCHKHGIDAKPFYSTKKNKWYCLHTYQNPITGKIETCFVNTEEEDDGFREKQVDYGQDNRMGEEARVED